MSGINVRIAVGRGVPACSASSQERHLRIRTDSLGIDTVFAVSIRDE
jgi:hypothetical protein